MSNFLNDASADMACLALWKVTGAQPSQRFSNGKIVIYWQGDELAKMQTWLSSQMTVPAKPGIINLDFDWVPVAMPLFLPQIGIGIGLLALSFAIGRMMK